MSDPVFLQKWFWFSLQCLLLRQWCYRVSLFVTWLLFLCPIYAELMKGFYEQWGSYVFLSFGMKDLCLLTLLHTSFKFWLRWGCWALFIHSLIIEHLPCIRRSPMCRGKVMSKTSKFLASLISFSPEKDKHGSNNPRNKNILLQIEICINFDCFWL